MAPRPPAHVPVDVALASIALTGHFSASRARVNERIPMQLTAYRYAKILLPDEPKNDSWNFYFLQGPFISRQIQGQIYGLRIALEELDDMSALADRISTHFGIAPETICEALTIALQEHIRITERAYIQ